MALGNRRWICGGLALACACGPGEAEREVDCAEDATVPLLSLASDERAWLAGRAGDAWVFEVKTYEHDIADIAAGAVDGSPQPIASRVVSVAGCGAEPREIGDALEKVAAPRLAGQPWIARTAGIEAAQGLWIIDPTGVAPASRLTSASEGFAWIEDGVLVVDGTEDDASILRVTQTSDGIFETTMERERVAGFALSVDDELVYDRLAFVTTDDELFVRDVATGTERLVQTGIVSARAFDSSARALLLGSVSPGRQFALDTDSGLEVTIGSEDEYESMSTTVGVASVEARFSSYEMVQETQLVVMPELRELELMGSWRCSDCTPLAGDSSLLQGPGGLYRLDPDTEEPVRVRQALGTGVRVDGQIYFFAELSALDGSPMFRLIRMDMDGSNAEDVLDVVVASVVPMAENRWAYVEGVDASGTGDLVVRDGESRELVATDVLPELGLTSGRDFVDPATDTQELAYQRTTADVDDNGIWLIHTDRL